MASLPPQANATVVVARPRFSEWISLAGLVVVLVGLIWAGGGYIRQVQENTRRIDALEASDRARGDRLDGIDVRLARIEAKLDMLTDEKGRDR